MVLRSMHRRLVLLGVIVFSLAAIGQAQFPPQDTPSPPVPDDRRSPFPDQRDRRGDQRRPDFGTLRPEQADKDAPPPFQQQQAPRAETAPRIQRHLQPQGPVYGFMHEFGAFQIQGQTGRGMFTLRRPRRFPRRDREFMYSEPLNYYGRYRDPQSRISGYLYYTDIADQRPGTTERRWFLFGERTVAQDTFGTEYRWLVYYNDTGRPTYYTQARFYTP